MQTMIERLISRKVGREVKGGEFVVADVDLTFSHDGNRPQSIDIFQDMGGERVYDPERVKLVIDHAPSVPNRAAAVIHEAMRTFAEAHQVDLFGPGEGISHQILPEKGFVGPGDFVLGTDSHTCTFGAFNAFGVGVGSTDLAAAMLTGQTWLKVPETIRVELDGEMPADTSPKDIVLALIRLLGHDGATYKALEFGGNAIGQISVAGRMTMANMGIEMGAKAALFPYDDVLDTWLRKRRIRRQIQPVHAEDGADYERVIRLDVSKIQPQVAHHPRVDHVTDVEEAEGLPIHQAVIGTCTNGRLEDLRVAARIISGRKVAPSVRFFVTPASTEVYREALEEGIIRDLVESGAVIGVPGCSGCTGGGYFAIPADGERVITSANRNFIGRLGNRHAELYLASPATVAVSALYGKITLP